MAAYQKAYYADPVHKAAALARSKKCYEENKEKIKARANLYAASHKEEDAAYRADPIHKARAVEQAKKYQSDPVRQAKYAATRRAKALTEEGKIKASEQRRKYKLLHPEAKRRHRAKRRTLGFFPLNSPFPRSEGHHLDMYRVLYIPQELHRSVRHNVWTGKNMEKINALAFAWVKEAEQAAT